MRFRRQLVLGYAALLFVMLVTGAAAVFALRVTTARLEHVASDLGSDLAAIQRLRFQAERAVASSRGYLLSGDAVSSSRFISAIADVDVSLAELEARQDLAPGIAEVDRAVRRYVDAARHAMAERAASDDAAAIHRLFETSVAPARDALEAATTMFVSRERAAFDRESERSRRAAATLQLVVGIATALGMLLSIALAVVWGRKLARGYALEREATTIAKRAIEARDEQLAIVSHDLRNPLTTIAMGTSLLQMDPSASPLVRKHVNAIGNAASRMEALIDELLDLAKLDAGKLELRAQRCMVASLLDTIDSLFQARATQAGIAFSVGDCGALAIVADRERVLQILSNLIGNAFKYTPAGGRVEVTARAAGERVRIEVADTGPGIPPDQLPLVFERYFQARAKGRGSLGLGLYICKQLVEAHRGEIGVVSEVGKGSTFWFELPR